MNNFFYRLTIVYFLLTLLVFSQDEIEKSLVENTQAKNKVVIGGYGELHYNYNNSKKSEESYLDFHRFVLFFGYNFNDKWFFEAELELEHNIVIGNELSGELELEQAHINFTPYPFFNLQGGVLLVAAGLINETHEPPLFLSVERPLYQNIIIPTTWFGNGFAAYGKHKSFHYRLFVMEGLNGDGISLSKGIRGARGKGLASALNQNGNSVNFKNPLYGLYVDYEFVGGKVGFSGSYNRAINSIASNNQPEETDLGLVEFHLQYIDHGFWGVFEIGTILYGEHNTGIQQSFGGYLDLGYNVLETVKTPIDLFLWVRYSWINTDLQTRLGGNSQEENRQSIWRVGFSLKPISKIAIKIDYGQVSKGVANDLTQEFNLGIGYYF